MAFLVNDEPIVIVCSGDKKIDNHKYKEYFKCKAKMIPGNDLESIIGFEPGGVTPFEVNDNVKAYLDISLKDYDVLYPAGGTKTSAIKLTLSELEKYSNFIDYIDVCK